jgi:hypothetical protein
LVVKYDGEVVGYGGWSKRRSLYGSDRAGPDPELDPLRDTARVRAFFVHPPWARRGIVSRKCLPRDRNPAVLPEPAMFDYPEK